MEYLNKKLYPFVDLLFYINVIFFAPAGFWPRRPKPEEAA